MQGNKCSAKRGTEVYNGAAEKAVIGSKGGRMDQTMRKSCRRESNETTKEIQPPTLWTRESVDGAEPIEASKCGGML